jgi:type II secretory pathway component PulM
LADSIGTTPVTKVLSITVLPPPTITPITLPNGEVTIPYSQTLTATGGVGAYTWTVTVGALPAGLSLSTAGVISGTPTIAGTSSFTVQVADANGVTASANLSITVVAGPAITPTALPTGEVTIPYSQTLTAIGGVGAYTWTVTVGTLPAGLSLSTAGVISGTPTIAGTSSFTVRVADANGGIATANLSITVTPLTPPTAPSNLALVSAINTTATTANVTISWLDNATTESGFQIQRAPVVGGVVGVFTFLATVGPAAGSGTTVTYTNSGVSSPGTYAYHVRAYRTSGGTNLYSPYTASLIVTVPATGTPPPAISSIAPISIVQGIATSVTINGTNLTGATVTFSNGAVGAATTATATQIIVPITGVTSGSGTVTVTTTGGSATIGLSVTAAPPTVSSIAPTSIVQGIATSVTINGTNLTGATVTFSNGAVGAATTATATRIIVPITGSTIGTGTVTVTTAGGSATGSLTVTPPSTTAPAAPSNLALVGVTNTSATTANVTISWLDNATTETGFQLQRAPVVNGVVGTFTYLATVRPATGSGTTVTFTNTGVTRPGTYAYHVRAYTISGGTNLYSPYTTSLLVTVP